MVALGLWQTVGGSELFPVTREFQVNLIRNVRIEIPEFLGVFPAFREVFMFGAMVAPGLWQTIGVSELS
jgi:hypothetical protein